MEHCNTMVQDINYKNHFVPKELCTFDDKKKITNVFSCEEYCSMLAQDCEHCKIQEIFDKFAKCEANNKRATRHFHLEQAKCLFYLIGQCDIILQQLDSLINALEY